MECGPAAVRRRPGIPRVRKLPMASTRNRTGNLFRPPRRGDTALTVATRWYDPAVIVATIDGVVDAANVDTLVDVVLDRAMLCCSLIVDLRDVTYMSISGLEALLLLHGRCEIADTRWTIIPSDAVQRLLHRFDTTGMVPTTTCLEDAFAAAELHVPIVQVAGPGDEGRIA
jgi:anti-anti-sigma regulatory factor